MIRFLILFIFHLSIANANTNIDCNENKEQTEIYKLFTTVKNDVLGKVPQFCRINQHDQLEEKINPKEKALTQFVMAQKKLKSTKKDILSLDNFSFIKKEDLIFETLKIIVLKKMWQFASDENRYSILLSKECGAIGLNRFPINKASLKITPSKKIDQQKQLNKIYQACSSKEFKDIAPFVTSDVLVESLLNLKAIFPQSFSLMVTSLCNSLKTTDELILKKNEYEDFASDGSDLKSVKDFSQWLQTLFSNYQNQDEIQAQQDKFTSEIVLRYNILNDFQMQLKAVYDSYQVRGKPERPAPYYSTSQIIKNSEGTYSVEMTPETLRQIEITQKKQILTNVKLMQDKMRELYQSKQNSDKIDMPVPDPKFPGLSVIKKNDFYFYIMDEQKKNDLMKKFSSTAKANRDLTEKPFKTISGQNKLKNLYKKQQTNKNIAYDLGYQVIKNSNGTYSLGAKIVPSFQKSYQKELEIYFKTLNAEGRNDPVPYPPLSENIIVYDKIEGYSTQPLSTTLPMVEPTPNNIPATTLFLHDQIKQKYQDKTSDKQKFANLSQEELSGIRHYTGNGHAELNNCLRESNCNEKIEAKINAITSGLKKLKSSSDIESRIFYRGVTWLSESDAKLLNSNPKNFVLEKGFLSTSGDISVANQFSGNREGLEPNPILFILKTKSCMGISGISAIPDEDEFLCPPGMKFNVQRKDPNKNIYILEETE